MQTMVCPVSGQKRKGGLGLDVKRGEVKVGTTNRWPYVRPRRLAKHRKKIQKEQKARQHCRNVEWAKPH